MALLNKAKILQFIYEQVNYTPPHDLIVGYAFQ